MEVFLDTSILVDLHRGYISAAIWLASIPSAKLLITPIVWMEMIEGSSNRVDERRILKLLKQFDLVYLTIEDMDWAMQQLEKFYLSHNVGMADCLIAAPVQRLNVPLYTRNLKHFSAILPVLAHKPY